MTTADLRIPRGARATTWLQRRGWIESLNHAVARRAGHEHWSLTFWPVAVASFVVVMLTGVALSFFYTPSTDLVRYDGPYAPLQGAEMSRALESTLGISFEVPGGLLLRQVHNWATSLMIAALLVHILQMFFTGSVRTPRRLTWLLLFGVLFAAMAAGLTGVVLPDDLASGSSLAVLDGVMKSIPVVGTWLSFLVFQGNGLSGAIATFYPLHVLVLPVAMVLLIVAIVVRALKHPAPQFAPAKPAPRIPEGRALQWASARRLRLFLFVAALLAVVGALVTVNPVWLYGPADPGNASAGVGAVWYLAFLDGAQRLMPPGWEFVWFDRTWTLAILVPVGVVGVFLAVAVAYPLIERWLTAGASDPLRMDRPRNFPTRTGVGVAGVVFFGVLWIAAASDTIASLFRLSLESVVVALQVTLLLGPLVAFVVTRRVCLGLQRKDADLLLHGHETGSIVRLPGGRYVERHAALTKQERLELTDVGDAAPFQVRPDEHGRISPVLRVRAALGRIALAGAIRPSSPAAHPPIEGEAPDALQLNQEATTSGG